MKLRSLAVTTAGVAVMSLVLAACGSDTPAASPSSTTAPVAESSATGTSSAGDSAAPSGSEGSAAPGSEGSAAPSSAGSAAPGSEGSAAPESSDGGVAPGSDATLTIWADDTRAKPLGEIAKKFTADTGAKVTIVQKDFGKMRDDFISQAPTGKGPDIVVGAHDWLGKLVQNGVVAPLELGDKAGQFQDVAIKAMSYDGQVYGLPYAVENIALVRNTALAPNAPKDFADAVATGQALVQAGKAKFPFLVQQDAKSGDAYHMYPFQTSFDAPVFGTNADGSYNSKDLAMKGANGEKFAAFLAKYGKEGVFKDTITADIAKDAFSKGQSPYIVTGPWNTGDFTKAGIKFTVEAIPSAGGQEAKPFVGVQGFFVSSKSKNDLLAKTFVLDYLSTEEVQLSLYKSGGRAPALTSAFEQIKADPVIAGFGAVGAKGTPQPGIPAMDAVWSDWGTTELALIQQKGDPKALWDKMATTIESKIAKG